MSKLNGHVVEKWTGLPVSGAIVNVNGATVIADASGHFSIDTPYQITIIQIVHVGYTTLSENVYLAENNDIEFNLVPVVRSL